MTKRKINDIEDNDPQEEFNQIKEDLLAGEPFYIKSPDDNLYDNSFAKMKLRHTFCQGIPIIDNYEKVKDSNILVRYIDGSIQIFIDDKWQCVKHWSIDWENGNIRYNIISRYKTKPYTDKYGYHVFIRKRIHDVTFGLIRLIGKLKLRRKIISEEIYQPGGIGFKAAESSFNIELEKSK